MSDRKSSIDEALPRRYGVAVIATGLALAVRLALDPFLGDHLPYVTFFVAVAVTTWYAGLGASLTAAVLGGLLSSWFFTPPRHSLAIVGVTQQVGFLTYWMVGLAFIFFGQAMRRAQQEAGVNAALAVERQHRLEAEAQDRTQAEEGLRLSEARYRELIERLPAAVYTCDEQGRIERYNHAAVALWGREPDIGKDQWCGSWKIYRPDGSPLPLDECPMAVTLREGRAVHGEEIVIERPDGTRRHVLPHPEPVRDARGRMVGAVNMLIDITERKEAERARAHLAAIVTSSDDAIVSKDLHGTVTSWNGAAERLFGYSANEMVGQSIIRLIPPDRRDEEVRILEQIARGEPIGPYETIRRRKDETDFHVSLTVSPLIDSQGNVIGAAKIARDITQQKRAEVALQDRDRALTSANDELIHQKAALAESNKELQSFSYSVSHDLRAPLRTIDAYVRIVEEDHGPNLNPEAQRCLGIVKKAAGQAGELIDDLLEFSRLGRVGMDRRPVKMTELAREVADDLVLMQGGRAIDLTIGDLPDCQGDWRLLKLVWTNLLTNAFKFTRSRPVAQIEVGWLPDDRAADASVYYVKDNGVGFDMKYVHKLFSVFQRLHLKEEFDGMGVGLAIVHRIVLRHGGRVWAEGKVDGGATVYFSLRKAM